MKLSELIKKYRADHKMSMQEFADRAGVSKGFISQIENEYKPSAQDRPMVPSIISLRKIASAMGIDVNDLISILDPDAEISLTSLDYPAETSPIITEHAKKLLAAYDASSPDIKLAVDRILKISDTSQLSLEEIQKQEIAQRAWVSEFGGGDDSALQRGEK